MDERSAKTISVREAAGLLGIAPNSCYRAARAGEIPSLRIGGRLLIPRGPLLNLLGEDRGREPSDA